MVTNATLCIIITPYFYIQMNYIEKYLNVCFVS